MPLLQPDPTDLNTPLPGESFDDFDQRRQSGLAAQAAQTQQDANDQAQRDQAATSKAYASQGVANYTDSTGAIQPIKATPDGPPLMGDGGNGGLVYGQDGTPQRVKFTGIDQPKLVDPYSPEGGGSTQTDKAGNTYATSPGAPWKWTGTDPAVQAQAQADAQDQQFKEQKSALDEASGVYGSQVTAAKQALAGHQKALDANTAALQNIPELAGGDFDPDADDAATKLPTAFAPTDPQYNETVGFWGGGGRSVAANAARDALAQRQQQAQALLAERQARQQAMDAVQDQHDTAQQRLDAVTQQRATLAKQRLQGDGLNTGDDDFDQAQAAANAPAGTANSQPGASGNTPATAGTAGTPDASQTTAPAVAPDAPLAVGDSVLHTDPNSGITRPAVVRRVDQGTSNILIRYADQPDTAGDMAGRKNVQVSQLQRPAADPTSTTPGQDASTTAAANDLTKPMPGESPDDFSARQASVQAAQAAATQTGQSAPGQSSPTQPPAPKPYSVGPDGSLSLAPTQMADGLLAANRDGLVPNDKLKALLPGAISADNAAQAQAALQQRVSADDWAKAKAFATGATRGGLFAAAALPGAEAGAVTGAELGSFAGPIGSAAGGFVGGAIGGLATGYAGSKVASAVGNELAQHSDTIKSFADASQALPQYDAAGNLVSMVVPGAAGLVNLGRVGAIRAAEMGIPAALKLTAKEAGAQAAGGAAFEGVIRPTFDWAIQQGKQALGIGGDPNDPNNQVQAPTVSSVVQNAILGVALGNLGTKFKGYDAGEIAGLYQRAVQGEKLTPAEGSALQAARDEMNARAAKGQTFITPDFKVQVEQALNPNGDVRAQSTNVSGQISPTGPLALTAGGTTPSANADQTPGGKNPPTPSTSPSFPQPSPVDHPIPQSDGRAAATASPSLGPLPSQASPAPTASTPAPAPTAAASLIGTGQTSPASTAPATGGQAQPSAPTQDDQRQNGQPSAPSAPAGDPALTALIQARDGYQKLLDAGKIAPEAEEATRAQLNQLSRQISAAQTGRQRPGQVPPGSTSPDPASPAASAPAAPAPTVPVEPPPPPRTSAGGSSSVPPVAQPSQEIAGSPSGEPSANLRQVSQSPATTEFHQSLADSVNSGATSQSDGLPPTPTFRALSMLRDAGMSVTPDLARQVDTQVQAIRADPTLPDKASKTQALKNLVASMVPAEQHADTPSDIAPASTAPQTQGGSDLQRTSPASSTAPATTDSAGSSLTVGDPVRLTSKAGNVVPATVQGISPGGDVQVKSRVGSATIPRAEIDSRPGRLVKAASSSAPASAPAAPSTPAAPLQKGDPVTVAGRPGTVLATRPGQPFAVVHHDADPLGSGLPAENVRVRVADLQRAPASSEVAPASPSAPPAPASGTAPAAPTAREPITEQGRFSKRLIANVTAARAAGRPVSDYQISQLPQAREALDRDLNRQVLGSDPQPTTQAGREAQQRIRALSDARDAGAQLSPSEHASWTNAKSVLQNDFTAQRQAIEARQQESQATAPTEPAASKAPALSQNEPAPPAHSSPAAPSSPSAFKPRQAVVYKGRNAVVEHIDSGRAVVRALAGLDPKTGANLTATRFRNVPLSALQAMPKAAPVVADAAPITPSKAAATAKAQLTANRALLRDLGVQEWKIGPTEGASGVEVGNDGVLKVSTEKLAASMTSVRDRQAKDGITGTPEEWFLHVLSEEGVHAADIAVAKSKGQTIVERYNALPDAAMPAGWQKAGRQAYGPKSWDALPGWAQKAEFTRMAVQGKWTGRITEQLFKFIKEAVDFLKGLSGFKDVDPRFRAHVEEVEQRLGRAINPDGTTSAAPRSFKMPTAPGGYHDVLDHIAAEGGMVSQARARGRDTFTKYAGDYDGAPTLGGFYHHYVYSQESSMMPDQMAETLHQNYGIGDGSPDGMWKAIQQAVDSRRAASAQQKTLGDAQKQTDRFDRDAVESATAKGAHAVNVAELNVGDHVTIGDQRLKVIGVDPDNLDVTLEDHTKYGVQRVADNTALYVEKIEPAAGSDDASLAASRPDTQTGELFGGSDDPFNLRADPASPAERVAAAKAQANRQPTTTAPTLRAGEKGTGDLFQGDDQPFNLAGETGIDHGARQAVREQAERATAEATALQDRQQGSLFAPADSRLKFPDNLYTGRSPVGRMGQLLREAYATGELSHSPETGLWSRGPKTALVARHLVDSNNERTLSEQRAILDGDKASLARNYAKAGNPKPLASLLTAREATLRAKEDALARFQAPADKSALSAAPTRDTGGLTEPASRNAWNSLGRAANGEKYAHLQPFVQAASPGSTSPADLGATYLRMLAQRRAGLPLTESGSRDTSALEQALDGPQPKMAEAALAKMPLAESDAPAAPPTADPAGSLKEAAPDVRKALREKIAALRRSKQGVSPDLTHWLAKLDGRGSFMANLSPEDESGAMASLHALDQEHGLGLDLGATAPATADPGLMAATDPGEDPDPLTESLFGKGTPTPAPASKGNFFQRARAEIARHQASGKLADTLSAHHDAADTMAGESGRQAKMGVALDLPNSLDDKAAGPLAEAGYNRQELTADLAKVQASPDKKLAAKYAPVYQHALDNMPRLTQAAEGWRQRKLAEDAAADRAGLPSSWQTRIQHVADDPLSPESTIAPERGFGATRGFKKAADAIKAGVDPKTTALSDHAERYVTQAQRAINEQAFQGDLASMKASDGKPLVSSIEESGTKLNAAGDPVPSAKVPAGYKTVQTGSNVLVVHPDAAPVLQALYGDSAIRQNKLGNAALDLAALIKHTAIGVDTYHGFQTAMRSILGFQVADYRGGLAGRDYADADLDRAVKAGKITQAQADDARVNRHVDNGLLAEGLNVGKVADNLLDSARQHNLIAHIPILGKAAIAVNNLTFHAIQPGYMKQAGRIAYARNKARFPELSEQELFRRSAKEVNEFYGSLGSQGVFKSKTMQDAARLIGFAPQFAEGRFRTEARGFAQAAKAPVDAAMGKGLRVGAIAQAMGGMILASLIGNQVLNLFTKGKPTWENEDGHRWDAWIPGGAHNRGFYFSPLSMAAEFSHELYKYISGGQSALDAMGHIASNKLSGLGRAVKDLATGTDYRGQPYGSMGERLKAAALELSPVPMQAGAVIKKDPKALLGYSLNGEPGAGEKQLFASAGLKLENAKSPRSQMYQIAQAFKKPGAPGGPHAPSEYSGLRQALDNQDRAGAQDAIRQLLQEGKSLPKIAKALGLHNGSAAEVQPEHFTGSAAGDRQMFVKLTPAQRATYQQAQRDRGASARLFAQWAPALLTGDPEVRRLATANLQQEQQARAASSRSSAATVATPGVPLLSTPPRRRFNGGSTARSLLTR